MMHRRSILQLLGSLGLGTPWRSDDADLQIGLAPTHRVLDEAGIRTLYRAARAVDDELSAALPDAAIEVGHTRTVEDVPPAAAEDSEKAWEWWRSTAETPGLDANVLLCSSDVTEWDHGGRGGADVAVVTGAQHLDVESYRALLVHEVGHCLGLDHEFAETQTDDDGRTRVTAMGSPDDGEDWQPTFSGRSTQRLQRRYG